MIDETQDNLRRDIKFGVILGNLLPLIPDEPIVQDIFETLPIIDLDLVATDSKATVDDDAVQIPTSICVEDL